MTKKTYQKPDVSREALENTLADLTRKLWESNQKLEREEQTRRELLANLSHDLRAPMTALASAVELLQSGREINDEDYRELLGMMSRRLKTMQSMMEELFLLSRIEDPNRELVRERVQAGVFLEEFFFSNEADSKYAERELVLEVPEDFPYAVEIDVEQIIRVLDNLFTNALRYSDAGARIILGASVTGEGDFLEISVRDTGMGIAEEDLPHIFERSYRADRSRTPKDNGSGLGLAIAKGIVERHGGRIECSSKVGEGSCFRVFLPLAK